MLSKLSLHQSGKEIKLGQGDRLTKRRTFVKLLKQTKRNPDKGSAKIIIRSDLLGQTEFLVPVIRARKSKDWHKTS